MWFLFPLSHTLLALLSLSTLVHSCHPSVWVVGLKEDQTIDNHLRIVGRPIPIQERRLDINGYTASILDDDRLTFQAIRSDPKVGFLVKVPLDYFRKSDEFLAAGCDGEDDEVYEWRLRPSYHWVMLQHRDPKVIDGSNCARRIPLTWEVKLEEGYSLDVHINLITQLDPTSLSVRRSYDHKGMYTLIFRSEEQERKSLPLIYDDARVEAIWPGRCNVDVLKYWIRIDGEDLAAWEDPCVFHLGYRQWDKEPIFSIPSKPSTMTLDPKVRSMRSKERESSRQNLPSPSPARIVYSWETKLAEVERELEERNAQLEKDMQDRTKYYQSQQLQRLARMKDNDRRKGIRREDGCIRHPL